MKLSRSRDVAFVMTEQDASKLNEKIRAFVGDDPIVRIEAECIDATRTFDGIKGLKDYENPRKKAMKSLVMSARSKDYAKQVSISLGKRWSPINVDMEGPESVVENHLGRIEEVVDGMKPWYAWLATIDFVSWILAAVAGLCVIGTIHIALTEGIKVLKMPTGWGEVLLLAIGIILVGATISRLHFPESCICARPRSEATKERRNHQTGDSSWIGRLYRG
jgi:hypothetical protein